MDIAEQVRCGNRLALARLLSLIENNQPEGQAILERLFPLTGQAVIIGITGPSGSGKSTLVNRLAARLAAEGRSPLAVLAVDPSSPFSGGALLGDRVRMRDLMEMPDIFIRSVATRGALGGLARAANEMTLAMEAGGFRTILVETVGAGQSEVDIARLAHTTLVVEAPGRGDDIQAAKAGILEIADILVVNKADKPGAEATARALETMLEIGVELLPALEASSQPDWKVPVLKTSALNDEGIAALKQQVDAHLSWLQRGGGWEQRSRARLVDLFERLLREELYSSWLEKRARGDYSAALKQVQAREASPYAAVRQLIS